MRTKRILQLAALVVATSLAGNGCLLIPEIKEKVVELAVSGATTFDFDASGELGVHDKRDTVDVEAELDVAQLLDDAGIDVSDVKDIKVSGVAYRVTQPDADPTREIQNGTVTAERIGATGEVAVISNFNQVVNAATAWQTAAVQPAGIALMNDLLADILASVQNGTPVANPRLAVHVSGDSSPAAVENTFKWEIKVTVSILGQVTVDVPE